MDLKKRYSRKDNRSLIEILETPDGYTKQALQIAESELLSRELDPDYLYQTAREIQQHHIIQMLEQFDPLNGQLNLPKSHFLNRSELKEMLISEFETLIKEKEGFRFDVMHYAIGAIL
ncbi:MAG: hypothetical protein KDC34_07575 [Saprospiraceae bacterium]|nr:hypothetical protein [Saprospiraceae bacterium]